MLKQQERIVKNGDYYEIQTFEELMMASKTSKKEEPIVSSTNIPASQYIVTEMPTFKEARSNYFFNAVQIKYQNKGAQQLKNELENMIKEQGLTDEDRREIQKLIDQISTFNDNKEVALNSLPEKSDKKSQAKNVSHKRINLKAKFGLTELQNKIKKLEEFNYPQLSFLEHQLQIMIGQKRPIQSVNLPAQVTDQKTREQLNHLYNHFSKMQSLNKISEIVNKVSYNNDKYVQMTEWVDRVSQISTKNYDFLSELREDQAILQKLQTNFNQNVSRVKQIIKELLKK